MVIFTLIDAACVCVMDDQCSREYYSVLHPEVPCRQWCLCSTYSLRSTSLSVEGRGSEFMTTSWLLCDDGRGGILGYSDLPVRQPPKAPLLNGGMTSHQMQVSQTSQVHTAYESTGPDDLIRMEKTYSSPECNH